MVEKKLNLDTLLLQKSKELQLALGLQLDHPVSQGDLSEGKWIYFLKSFLPHRYDVSKGYVFDRQGGLSEQIDVIVYDPFHSPLIYETENGEKYVTAESVYAVFEVKPKADKGTLEYAANKIESALALDRGSRGMVSSGKLVPPRELTHIIGGLLTTDAVGSMTIEGHLSRFSNIDIVCSATTGTFFKNGSTVVHSSPEESVQAFFYLLLDELHKIGTVPAIDIRDYADRALKSFKLERGDI